MTERRFCVEPHEHGPNTLHAWLAWAEERDRTHTQHRCPDCGLDVIWRPRTPEPAPVVDEPALLDLETP